jgi:hypothetical protein
MILTLVLWQTFKKCYFFADNEEAVLYSAWRFVRGLGTARVLRGREEVEEEPLPQKVLTVAIDMVVVCKGWDGGVLTSCGVQLQVYKM